MYEQLRLRNQLCFRFYTVSRLITQTYRPFLERLGLTYPQYLVMMVLWEQDGQPVNDIAKTLMLETNTVTPLLKRMEEDGLVTRRRGEKDARQVLVHLTDKGRKMEAEAAVVPIGMGEHFSSCDISPEKAAELYPILDSMISALQSGLETASA
jgi:DNA-binding MarR family transcriptional regulator